MTSAFLEAMDERGVATLTLNRQDRHNAFDDALIAELTAAFDASAMTPASAPLSLPARAAVFRPAPISNGCGAWRANRSRPTWRTPRVWRV